MSPSTDRDPNGRDGWIAPGVVLVPVLLGAGALAALGSWLLTPWPIGAAGLAVLAVVGWRLRRRSGAALDQPCCPPVAAGPRSSIHHQER